MPGRAGILLQQARQPHVLSKQALRRNLDRLAIWRHERDVITMYPHGHRAVHADLDEQPARVVLPLGIVVGGHDLHGVVFVLHRSPTAVGRVRKPFAYVLRMSWSHAEHHRKSR